jgi:hypothetical protein
MDDRARYLKLLVSTGEFWRSGAKEVSHGFNRSERECEREREREATVGER